MNSVAFIQDSQPNVIKVKAQTELAGYVKYAIKVFRTHRTLVMKGAGNATSKVLHLTEILKRRIGNLHQINHVYSVEVDNRRECQDGRGKKRMSIFESILSVDPLEEDDVGYQEPIAKERRQSFMTPQKFQRNQQRRGFYRGGRSPRYENFRPRYGPPRDYDDFYDSPHFTPRPNFRRGYGHRYSTDYKPRRYQNQWIQDSRPNYESMSQGPSYRFREREERFGGFYSNEKMPNRRGFSTRKKWRNRSRAGTVVNFRTPESSGKVSSRMSSHQD
ncbi:unnamed protein product [Moneuplotes crassus]|uniref:DNA/RNA-binding protein Alba-like domain-containing protein n=1 Tax=Euplotes crassus TaxID=5936 RepID=A0AAD1XMR8_EUPCR|nr:unnamed protein product [Moneuplotes crassus]